MVPRPRAVTLHVAIILLVLCSQRPTGQEPLAICISCAPRFLLHAFDGTIVRNSGKCLGYTPDAVGSPVSLNRCDVSHSIQVRELNPSHEVALVAGSLVIGIRRTDPIILGDHAEGGAESVELPLELQTPAATAGSWEALNQTFALDGDSIISVTDRHLVAKVQQGRGADGTPIVAGVRQLSDSEFWDFRATDGSGRDPSRAFLHVASVDGLLALLNTYDCFPERRRLADGHAPPPQPDRAT